MIAILEWLGVRGIVAAVALGLLGLCYWRLDAVEADLVATRVARDAALSANVTSVAAIAKLRQANEDLAKRVAVDPRAARDAIRALQTERDKLAGDLRRARTERQKAYDTHPDCDAFRHAVVCPVLTGGLRDATTDRPN